MVWPFTAKKKRKQASQKLKKLRHTLSLTRMDDSSQLLKPLTSDFEPLSLPPLPSVVDDMNQVMDDLFSEMNYDPETDPFSVVLRELRIKEAVPAYTNDCPPSYKENA
ncbi:hypothetical protein SJAG_01893 [Schizosaccharomyces japonicus yFS275]|uniref:Uncharacterized protein n=1 Tax=Schizosaccharomyces japonicus (strain yFS275 / FY16936) TaxID=402676 RepID=B6JZ68_SCHJY|nr:hypothetical protein SJAG_01893 [Schizosaccharomyces japonicus yFS275]EEB06836.1 hypothetical protein SJAG_01893 [Schizosaccharomyces japonicus yFS275]